MELNDAFLPLRFIGLAQPRPPGSQRTIDRAKADVILCGESGLTHADNQNADVSRLLKLWIVDFGRVSHSIKL